MHIVDQEGLEEALNEAWEFGALNSRLILLATIGIQICLICLIAWLLSPSATAILVMFAIFGMMCAAWSFLTYLQLRKRLEEATGEAWDE